MEVVHTCSCDVFLHVKSVCVKVRLSVAMVYCGDAIDSKIYILIMCRRDHVLEFTGAVRVEKTRVLSLRQPLNYA